MTNNGSIILTTLFKAKTDIFLALGTGPGGIPWVDPPEEDPTHTELLAEIGRRRITLSNYVVEDPVGTIGINNNYYSTVLTPTYQLYLKFMLDIGDAADETICQFGIFTNVVTDPILPEGQNYFTQDQLIDPGQLFFLVNIPAFTVDPVKRLIFDCVLEF